jgi:hypothetical protein
MNKCVMRATIACLLAMVPVTTAFGQGVGLGFKVGLNGANVSLDPDEDTSIRLGLVGGGVLSFMVHDAFAIQLEALYSQKGADVDDIDGGSGTLAVDYFEVPLLAKVMVPTGGNVRPVFFVGPAVAFEISCSISAEAMGVSVDVDCDASGLDGGLERKKTDFGILGGAGLEVDAGPVVVTFEGRYNFGLTNLDDSGDPGFSIKSRTFSILAGLLFKLPT